VKAPELSAATALAGEPEPAAEPAHEEPSRPTPSDKRATESWQRRAERGDYRGAYALLSQSGSRVADDVEDLLLAADSARLSGHPAQAVPYLRKVTSDHASDPRAPLAAFTLGGVLMSQLGKPLEAQAAYARARALSPNSALSQDALARQVEAAYRAGDAALARKLAEDYLASYPNGRRVHAVRRFGGLP
jgi:transmembrane sensor